MLSFKPTFSLSALTFVKRLFSPSSLSAIRVVSSAYSEVIDIGHLWTWGVHVSVSYLLPFLTVHGVLKARILKWFAIPFSSGPHFVRTLHHDPSILGGPTQHGLVSLS